MLFLSKSSVSQSSNKIMPMLLPENIGKNEPVCVVVRRGNRSSANGNISSSRCVFIMGSFLNCTSDRHLHMSSTKSETLCHNKNEHFNEMVKPITQYLMLLVSAFCIFSYKQKLLFKMHGSIANDPSFMFCFLMKSFSHFH